MDAAQISPAQPAARQGGDLRQLVAAGAMRFAIGFDESRQYLDGIAALTRIPRSPPWLLGAFGSDGAAVPLIDIEAWAQHAEPAPWRLSRTTSDTSDQTRQPGRASASSLRALRMGDGPDAWAIRVTDAPSVVSLPRDQSRAISPALPLSVSSVNGHLMPHASAAWLLPDNVIALQIRWAALAEILRQELAGIATAERRMQ